MKCSFISPFIYLLISLLFLTACETTGSNQQRTAAQGALGGAVAGAIIGNRSDAEDAGARGALIGGIAGAIIGSSMGEAKDKELEQARKDRIEGAKAQREAAILRGSSISESEISDAKKRTEAAEAELYRLKSENAEAIRKAKTLEDLRQREIRALEEINRLKSEY